MNLSLSPHGIWCYRKVITSPGGHRKEIKKSLHTHDKPCVCHKVTQLLAKSRDNIWCGSCRTARDRLAAVTGQDDGSGGYVACSTPPGPKS